MFPIHVRFRLPEGNIFRRPGSSAVLGKRIEAFRWRIKYIPLCVQVDEDEAIWICSDPNLEEAIVFLLEARNSIKLRRFRQVAFGIIAPTMIPATQDERRPHDFPRDFIGTMAAYVVEATEHIIFPHDQEEWEIRYLEAQIIPCL